MGSLIYQTVRILPPNGGQDAVAVFTSATGVEHRVEFIIKELYEAGYTLKDISAIDDLEWGIEGNTPGQVIDPANLNHVLLKIDLFHKPDPYVIIRERKAIQWLPSLLCGQVSGTACVHPLIVPGLEEICTGGSAPSTIYESDCRASLEEEAELLAIQSWEKAVEAYI